MNALTNDWNKLLKDEFNKAYYTELRKFLEEEYAEQVIYPEKQNIFAALNHTPYNKVKVVILGQDPYHGLNQAHGLSFSVKPGIKIPPSLKNIYKELQNDIGCYIPNNGSLIKWAEQGVLLLNTSLTVREGKPSSHNKIGWHIFTDKVITLLNEKKDSIIFVLWGNHAKSKETLITNKRHYVIKAPHPSPFSATKGFFGSQPFSKINTILAELKKEVIDWQIEDIDF